MGDTIEAVLRDIRSGICRIHYSYMRCVHCDENVWTMDGIDQVAKALERGDALLHRKEELVRGR